MMTHNGSSEQLNNVISDNFFWRICLPGIHCCFGLGASVNSFVSAVGVVLLLWMSGLSFAAVFFLMKTVNLAVFFLNILP